MSDPSDTTPLVTDAAPASPDAPATTTRSMPNIFALGFKWYHYLVLVLATLGLVAAILSSLESVWKFIFVTATLLFLFETFIKHVLRLKPDSLPIPYLVTQFGFGYFIAPFFFVILVILLFIIIVIVFAIVMAIDTAIFSYFYPDAMQAFADDVQQLSEQFASEYPKTRTFTRAVLTTTTASVPTVMHLTRETAAEMNRRAKAIFAKIWNDMVAAGASPIVMGIDLVLLALIFLFLFLVVGGLGSTGILEKVKWKLFKRHEKVPPSSDASTPANTLGVKGLISFAVAGSGALVLCGVLNGAYDLQPTFYAGVIYLLTSTLDVMVITLTAVLVATAYAEKAVLDKEDTMRKTFKSSIVITFVLALVRVAPPMKENGGLSPNVIAFIILTGLRMFGVYKLAMYVKTRVTGALDDEQSAASA